jgi:hypothetical protein
MKYTKESLEPAVKSSLSVAEVTRKLGLKNPNGGTCNHVSRRIKKFGIDTSHFLGRGRNRGTGHKPERLSWEKILVNKRTGRKEKTTTLRLAMVASGIPHTCGTCGLLPEWNGEPLVLQISHKDGNSLNNERKNLHFQCPNCHSQTSDFAGRGKNKSLSAAGGTADALASRASAFGHESANLSRRTKFRPCRSKDRTAVF